MLLEFRWIKSAGGTLDSEFAASLARHFGLRAFVETGTYHGDTIAALADRFEQLVSIELEPDLADKARDRFRSCPKVSIIQGNSADGLNLAFRAIGDQPALVWLDAHYSGQGTARGQRNTPILEEVDCIARTRHGRDVILIDDLRYFWPVVPGFLNHESLAGYPLAPDVASALAGERGIYRCLALGDALLAIPAVADEHVAISDVLGACTQSRLRPPLSLPDPAIEEAIAAANGAERDAIRDLPDFIKSQSDYGLAGHYFYWRSLLRPGGTHSEIAADRERAVRCQVIPRSLRGPSGESVGASFSDEARQSHPFARAVVSCARELRKVASAAARTITLRPW